MVKQSKGKSIRGAKWFGQEQVFSETKGKPAECDPTRAIKSIIPKEIGMFDQSLDTHPSQTGATH